MTLNKDKTVQHQLFQQYYEDILSRNERYTNERLNAMNHEKQKNIMIAKELEAEKLESQKRKRELASLQYSELLQRQEEAIRKKILEQQAKMNPESLSLNLNSDTRLNLFKEHIIKLSDNADRNRIRLNNYSQHPYQSHRMNINNTHISADDSGNNVAAVRREKTSITDGSIFDKYNNKDYEEYKDKNREYFDYNLYLSQNKEKSKEMLYDQRLEIGGHMAKERKFYNNYEKEAKRLAAEQKQQYKNILDEQRKFQITSKLANERYTVESAVCNPQFNHYYNASPPNQAFLNNNRFVEVNPYNVKNYDLGDSFLNHNVILNPKFDYKYNHYMFPNQNSIASPIRNVGYNITSNPSSLPNSPIC